MADVARLAGVSSQTVSRVSTGHLSVAASTRHRVLAAMQELGYQPNAAARALKLGEFRTIGVIPYELSLAAWSRVIEAITVHAANEGYSTMVIPGQALDQQDRRGMFIRLGNFAVDGIVLIADGELPDTAAAVWPPEV